MKKPIKIFSAFTGIGAFEKALQDSKIPHELVGFLEIDKFAEKTFLKNFPDQTNFGDITKIDAKKLPNFDLFVGGFPCQAFSIAGKRKGFEDTRGTLFFDCARIMNEKMPKYAIFENVRGLTTHDDGKTLEIILDSLRSLGYAVDFQVLNSKYYRVPQNRERIFIVCVRNDLCGTLPDFWHFNFPKKCCEQIPLETILEKEESIDKKYFLSNKQIGKMIDIEYFLKAHDAGIIKDERFILSESRTDEAKKERAEMRIRTGKDYSPRGKKKLSPRYDGICGTITATSSQGDGNLIFCFYGEKYTVRVLTPIERERLQGFPDEWTAGVSDTQRFKQIGNSITVSVAKQILLNLFQKS